VVVAEIQIQQVQQAQAAVVAVLVAVLDIRGLVVAVMLDKDLQAERDIIPQIFQQAVAVELAVQDKTAALTYNIKVVLVA
jgi:hypothetical protein